MASTAQLEANRANAQLSTGPRTEAGKARSACNATTHGLTSRVPVAISRGPFAEDPGRVQAFIDQVVRDLEPVGVQEQAEATHIAALYVRMQRLLGLEAAAVTASTRATVSETLQDLADPYAHLDDATGARTPRWTSLDLGAEGPAAAVRDAPEQGVGPFAVPVPGSA
jgi:hypothetical protein